MAFSRRKFLVGLGGAVVGLPFLEGLGSKEAKAANDVPPYALFYRRGNGVQQAMYSRNCYPTVNDGTNYWFQQETPEVERWWPMMSASTPYPFGPLATFGTISALSEIEAYVAKTTLVKGLRHPYGTENGHPEGAVQGLTGAGVKYTGDVPGIANCVPMGESLDNRIANELSGGKSKTSLFMGFRSENDATVSWLKSGTTLNGRPAITNLQTIYDTLFFPFTQDAATRELLKNQRKSVNDLVRSDINRLKTDPRMSKADLDRLDLHLSVIRDTEVSLSSCALGDIATRLTTYDSASLTQSVDIMGRLAALAIACGVSRSVVMSMGIPQDIIPYNEISATIGQYPFHAISHRQIADVDGSGVLAGAANYHHAIDRYHLQRFRTVLDTLSLYTYPDGTTLVDKGVNVHFSDLGAGQHTTSLLPYVAVGGAGERLATGKYIDAGRTYLVKYLNTIGAAVGVKNDAGNAPLDDFNSKNGILPDSTVVPQNNNYLSRNYTDTYYWKGPGDGYAKPTDGKPAITGRIAALEGPKFGM